MRYSFSALFLGLFAIAVLFLAGCKTNVTVEVYSSDLDMVATDKSAILTTPTQMAIEIPSVGKCAEYTPQIVDIMKGVVKDFDPKGCKRQGMESFLIGELQTPIVSSTAVWEKTDSLFGLVVKGAASIMLNRKKYQALSKRMSDKFHQTLKLQDSTISIVLHNDMRETVTYAVEGVFVDGDPCARSPET